MNWRADSRNKSVPISRLLPLLESAVAQVGNRPHLKLRLAAALFHLDRMSELVESFRSSVSDENTDPQVLYYIGRAALATQDLQLAYDVLSLAVAKGSEHACGYRAETLQKLGLPEQALASALQGLEVWPSDYKSLGIVVQALLDRGESERLWELCAELATRGAWGGYLPSAMALAATEPEHVEQIAALIDRPRWFCATQLAPPSGFNEELATEILTHKSLAPLPSSRATVGTGQRIDQFELFAGSVGQGLLDRVCKSAETYIAERQHLTQHPMISHQPEKVSVSSWAVSVRDDGHETWHTHPSGWLSGVYYVQVPEIVSSGSIRAGAVDFGPYPFSFERECTAWPIFTVLPQPGLLLLFPSYYGHRTWPTGVGDSRVCVAFDLMPMKAAMVQS